MKYKVELLINNEQETLVKHHEGKLRADGTVSPLKGQKGVACTLTSRERLRVFFGKSAESSKDEEQLQGRSLEKLIKPLKKILSVFPVDYTQLLLKSFHGFVALNCNPFDEVFKSRAFIKLKIRKLGPSSSMSDFAFFQQLSSPEKELTVFFSFLDKMDSLTGFKNLDWKISDGFEGLKKALEENGQIIFQGKYGKCFHGAENTVMHSKESSASREVYFFKPNTLRPSSWTHCVIVDQVKIVDNKPFVYFRDPYDPSMPGQPAKVYMLSYKSFIERISDKYGNPRDANDFYGLACRTDSTSLKN